MGRKFTAEPYKKWKVLIPATLAGRIEFYFLDPITGKPKYGDRGRLITQLLEEWLAKQEHRT
jgi:hypothetical protein